MIQTIQTNVSLPYDLLQNLEYAAAQLHLEKDRIVTDALTDYLNRIGKNSLSSQHAAIKVSDKFINLEPHPESLSGDPEDIVHLDWNAEWKYDLP